ncbi:response regulator transcription factor [Aliikangiella sp. G2MR2-5]|uniref:response regulator transcription factor n=1 Tax=Aliikangiella sp. G2MR2-5 TaxID=2788943 RepID=UPI0018AAD7D0|nr:response regulator [Aliikangiella sp. G2MR2-5]
MALKNKSKSAETRPVIYIIDDEPTQREFCSLVLDTLGVEIIKSESVEQFLKVFQNESIGCILSDVVMPGLSGSDFLEIAIKHNFRLPIIFFTAYANVDMAKSMLKKGAFDFLEKPINAEELISSVRKAIAKSVTEKIQFDRELEVKNKVERLTKREKQVLYLMLDGLSSSQISNELSIGERTVETHRASILKKFESKSFSELTCNLIQISGLNI